MKRWMSGSRRRGLYGQPVAAGSARSLPLLSWVGLAGLVYMVLQPLVAGDATAATVNHAQNSSQWYSTLFGGSKGDAAHAVAVDRWGNIYLAGGTTSPDFPTRHAAQAHLGGHARSDVATMADDAGCIGNSNFANGCLLDDGARDAFVVKVAPNGRVIYSSYLGGSRLDDARAVAVDAQGNAYVAGYTNSPDFPVLHPFKRGFARNDDCLTGTSCQDAFVAKLDPRGRLLFSSYLGGRGNQGTDFFTGDDAAYAIALSPRADVYVAGQTHSVSFPGTSSGPVEGAFVSRLRPRGNEYYVVRTYVQSRLSGMESHPSAYAIAIDPDGSVLVAGATFLLKLRSSLTPIYAFAIPGEARGVATDRSGNGYVTGTWDQSGPFTPVHAVQQRYGGGRCRYGLYGGSEPCTDAFVLKVDPRGKTLYRTLLGGSGDDEANAIAVDRRGNAFVAGVTGGHFPVKNSVQADFGGGSGDAFLVKIPPDGNRIAYSTYLGGSGLDISDGVALAPNGSPVLAGDTDSGDFPISSTGSHTSVASSDASRIFFSRLPLSPRLLVRSPEADWIRSPALDLMLVIIALSAAAAWYLTRRKIEGDS